MAAYASERAMATMSSPEESETDSAWFPETIE